MKRKIIRDKDTNQLKYSRRVTDSVKGDYTMYFANYFERLDVIAYKFYNDSSKWKVIARANNMRDIYVKNNNNLKIPLTEITLQYKEE